MHIRGFRLAFGLFLAIALLTAACSSNKESGGGQPAEVSWWVPDSEQNEAMKFFADDFNQSQSEVRVNLQTVVSSEYYSKLQTVLAASDGPDVMWMNGSTFPKFQSRGFFLAYDEYVAADQLNLKDYPQWMLDYYSADGKLYALPKDFDTIGLFYNKTLFDQAKVAYPDGSWTWEKLREAAKQLTIEGQQWGIATHLEAQEVVFPMMVQNGIKPVEDNKREMRLDSPEAIEAVQFLYDLMYVDKYSPDGIYMSDNDPYQLFQSGKVAMMFSGPYMARPFYDALGDQLDVAMLPERKNKGNIIHGISWAINAKAKNPDASWKFVKYLASKEVALKTAEMGTAVPAFIGTAEPWTKSMPMNLQIFIDSVEYAEPYPSTPNSGWEGPLYANLANIWMNKVSPADGMKQAAKEVNEWLQQ